METIWLSAAGMPDSSSHSAEVVQLQVSVDLEGKGPLEEVPPHTVHGERHGPDPTQLGSAWPRRGAAGRRGA